MNRGTAAALIAASAIGAAVRSGAAAECQASAGPLRTLVTVSLPGEPANLAFAGASVWTSVPAEAILLRIDARSGRRLQTMHVTDRDRHAFGAGPVAAWRGIVWVAAPVHVDDDPSLPPSNSGWIGRLDIRTGRMRITFVRGDPPAAIAAGPAGVWVSGGKTLRRIDERSGRVVASVSLGSLLGDVAVGAVRQGRIWLSDAAIRKLLRVGR
jgi:hypothetical protein